MSVVPRRSDVFAPQKLASRSVHGSTLLDRLFQKAYGKLYTTCGYWESSTYQKRHGCRWFHEETSLRCKLAAQKCARMYIFGRGCPWCHSEATFCTMHKSRRQNAQGWAGNKSETSFGTKLVLYRCTWTYIGREVHGSTLLDRLFQKA